MAYTLRITVIDEGTFYNGAPPPFSGFIRFPPNSTADTATSTTSPSAISFTESSPPTRPGSLLLTDPSGPGDVFRSGLISYWPPPLSPIMIYTVPVDPNPNLPGFSGAGRFSYAELDNMASMELPMAINIDAGAGFVCWLLTAGKFYPGSLTLESVSFMQSPSLPGIIRAVFGGFIDATSWFGSGTGANCTGSIDLLPLASADPINEKNVIQIIVTNLSLNVDALGASPGVAYLAGQLAPNFSGTVGATLSNLVNDRIASMVGNVLSTVPGLTQTATLSARKISVTSGGITIQVVASDLERPGWMMVSVAPQPKASANPINYTVTVTELGTGTPIEGATVTIHNFTTSGTTTQVTTNTDQNGRATVNIALHSKQEYKVENTGTNRDGKPMHLVEKISESPTITVDAANYTSVNRPLF